MDLIALRQSNQAVASFRLLVEISRLADASNRIRTN
jgi:hypothetical protein